ncbi:TRM11 family methyltransferase [Nonomuraea sp. NPDC050783]|uniref:TRM11 family SAM-dependent methyltransferase n=1 Tax=Nonomuraea sp. NPDC050783 TaxID=3154634 RepID=UPI0034676ADC
MHTFAVARAVHGIEPLVATEIRRSGAGVVRGMRHREVWFEATGGTGLPALRTADDVLLAAAVVDGIGRDRSALRRLARAARGLDPALLGVPAGAAGVEVSASFVGRRNYTRFEVEDAVGAELARPLRVPYHSRGGGGRPPHGAMAWRVTIEEDRAVIAVRPARRPLHRRAYKTASVRGTLHPPLAAAMAELARLDGARTVLDPCCGAGTTLIEARALAPRARFLGFDHSPAALAAAAANALTAAGACRPPGGSSFAWARADGGRLPGESFAWARADGGRLPVRDGAADRVLVNPPWGRQVPPAGLLAGGLGPLWRQVRRVLAADGLAVALVHDDLSRVPPGFAVEEAVRVSLSGRHPVIAVLAPRRR